MEGISAPSVITSEVYNQAEAIFNVLQNKEKLVSFLDCTTLLRGMGMNPTLEDMDRLKARMAEPVLKLEQWRREEELRREKERRKEEARDKKRNRGSSVSGKGAGAARQSTANKAPEVEEAAPVKIVPAEEIKNIDWNIFISCAEEMFRDAATEEKSVLAALHVFQGDDVSSVMSRDRLVEIVTTNGDNILTPAEVKQLVAVLPEECTFKELAARLQGTYVPPSKEDLDRVAAQALEEKRQREEAERAAAAAADDPLSGL